MVSSAVRISDEDFRIQIFTEDDEIGHVRVVLDATSQQHAATIVSHYSRNLIAWIELVWSAASGRNFGFLAPFKHGSTILTSGEYNEERQPPLHVSLVSRRIAADG